MLQAIGFIGVMMAAGGTSPPLEHLTIRIVDKVTVPPTILQRAIREVQSIFLQARIETIWSVGRIGDERYFLHPTEVSISILHRSLGGTTPGALGQTYRMPEWGMTMAVFYDKIDANSEAAGRDPSELLGVAMAHEIGHFFGLNHAVCGVMVANLAVYYGIDEARPAQLRFAGDQATTLRRAIARWKRSQQESQTSETAPKTCRKMMFSFSPRSRSANSAVKI